MQQRKHLWDKWAQMAVITVMITGRDYFRAENRFSYHFTTRSPPVRVPGHTQPEVQQGFPGGTGPNERTVTLISIEATPPQPATSAKLAAVVRVWVWVWDWVILLSERVC